MAAGKPIISNIPGWGSLLAQEYGAGLILDGKSIESSARSLVSHIENKEWLSKAGAKSLQLGTERFSRDKLAVQLE